MRDLSAGPSLLSVNTATVRKQAGLLGDPDLAVQRMHFVMATHGVEA